jgi:hypothetical protein
MILQPDRDGMMSQRFVLLKKNTLSPDLLRSANDLTGTGWAQVEKNIDPQRLERKLFAAGWTFFYTAWLVKTIGFGFEKPTQFGD